MEKKRKKWVGTTIKTMPDSVKNKSDKKIDPPQQKPYVLTVMENRDVNLKVVEDYAEAARKRGWGFCRLEEINSDRLARYELEDLPLDFVIFRSLANNLQEIQRVVDWLEQRGAVTINMGIRGGYAATSDKHYQQGLFILDPIIKKYALPTYEAKFKKNILSYVEGNRVHYPFLLKFRFGSTGRDIVMIESEEGIDKVKNLRSYVIEQYIEPECDYRIFVIGGVAVGIMRKYGDPEAPDDFMAWSGGRERFREEDPQVTDLLSEIATRAAAAARTEYVGVDVLREKETGRFYLLENNIAAGWLNFTEITHINIPELTIDWLEDRIEGQKQPFAVAVEDYLEKRKKYLPERIRKSCEDIMKGVKGATEPYREIFANYPDKHTYDAGLIFEKLSKAYDEIAAQPDSYLEIQPEKLAESRHLVQEIEAMPFSWAGNFVGPEVGTLHDGAILTSLYLFLRKRVLQS